MVGSDFHFHIVLVEPQIPPNTGNAGRLCVAVNATLHLIEPLGFSIEDKDLRRAGLDYWKHVDLVRHENFDAWLQWRDANAPDMPFYMLTKKAEHSLFQTTFPKRAAFVFGKETKGLSDELLSQFSDRTLTIPMFSDKIRSLNLSNAISIVIYEAIRQQL